MTKPSYETVDSDTMKSYYDSDDNAIVQGIPLHVQTGSSGGSAQGASLLTLEADTTNVLQFLTPSANVQQIRFGDAADDGAGIIQYDHAVNAMQFNVNGPEKMRIDADGQLGIGTTDPTNSIDIQTATNSRVRATDGTRSLYMGVWSSQPRIESFAGDLQIEAGGAYGITFDTNGTQRMRIKNQGEIQIGGTTNAGFLDFDGTSLQLNTQRNPNTGTFINTGASHAGITLRGASGGSEIRFYTAQANNTAGSERMRLEADGDLHVDGDVVAFSATISDIRLKENVEVVESAVEKVQQLRGVTFDRHDGARSAGVIAQDVEEVLPEAIVEKELAFVDGGKYKTVQYDALHALLIEAIKELKAEIEELKK